MEKTLALIKPDAVRAGHARDILRRIEGDGFSILRRKELRVSTPHHSMRVSSVRSCAQLTTQDAEDFYREHKERSFYTKLVKFMSSGPIVAMILARKDAIRRWRELMGPTDSVAARKEAPQRFGIPDEVHGGVAVVCSIRAACGTDGTYNAVHGSDSCQSAQREIRFFFPESVSDIPSSDDAVVGTHILNARQSVGQKLDTVLLEGLTALAKKKPTGNEHDAIRYLGEWLIANNPKKPENSFRSASNGGHSSFAGAITADHILNVDPE